MSKIEKMTIQDQLRYLAQRMAEGATVEEIAIELKVCKLAIENTMKLIEDIVKPFREKWEGNQ